MTAHRCAPVGPHDVPLVALEREHASIEGQLQAALALAVESSEFTLGVALERFEQAFAEYCGVSHCVGVGSGTAALMLTLQALGVGPGDEVIVPAHTFIASALAVAHVGATPVLCDVEEGTGLIDPDAARGAVTRRTVAVVAVHLYGQACDMDAIGAFARPAGLLVLEDAAQAHGAVYRDRRAGSLGAAGAFSFYPTKNLGALGDGGAVCTDDAGLASRLRSLRNLGRGRQGEHVELGHTERLDSLQAAFLHIKLEHLDHWNEQRRQHAQAYRELLAPGVRTLEEAAYGRCVYHLFPVRLTGRDRVAAALREKGIATGIHYAPAVHRHPVWAGHSLRHELLPRAEAWAAEELSLPMHPYLQPEELDRVAKAVTTCLETPVA